MLHIKYQGSKYDGVRHEDFHIFSSENQIKQLAFRTSGHNLKRKLAKVQLVILHSKYKGSYDFRQKEFKVFI